MHPRLEEVLNYLDTERSSLRDTVELVPVARRDESPGTDRWSVGQVLQHLVMIEKRIGRGMTKWVVDARAGGLGPETETSSVMNSLPLDLIADRTERKSAPEQVSPRGDLDAAALDGVGANPSSSPRRGAGRRWPGVGRSHPTASGAGTDQSLSMASVCWQSRGQAYGPGARDCGGAEDGSNTQRVRPEAVEVGRPGAYAIAKPRNDANNRLWFGLFRVSSWMAFLIPSMSSPSVAMSHLVK